MDHCNGLIHYQDICHYLGAHFDNIAWRSVCVGLADAEIQEDLLKHSNQDMGVEETIRFVEIRAAGKRSAASMTTPTTASAIDEEEGGEAIASNYRRLQRRPTTHAGQGQAKTTPPDLEPPPQTTPSPKSRAIPVREQPQPKGKEATPPEPHLLTGAYAPFAARQDTESKRGRPTGDYTARHDWHVGAASRMHRKIHWDEVCRCEL